MDQFIQVLSETIVSVLGVIVSIVAAKAMSYLKMKKQEVIAKIGANQYNLSLSIAESIFHGIEQQMQGSSGLEKRDEFNKRIAAKIPGITVDDVDHLREAVVGKAKAMIKMIATPAPCAPTPVAMPWQLPTLYTAQPIPSTPGTFECTTTNSVDDTVIKSTHTNPETIQVFQNTDG